MTTDTLVLLDRPRPDVAVITLNRPDRLNALSFALVDELHAALDDVQRDNDVWVVILTGAGRGEVMEAATAFMEKRPPSWAAPTPDGRT
jgi:enoyl-CoA hydratase